MNRKAVSKAYLFSLASILFLGRSLAASSDSFLGAWTGLSGAGSGVSGIIDAVLWYEINSLPQAAIFVAVFGGIYFVTIKIVHMAFSYITGAINLGTNKGYSVSHSDDGPSTAEKGASAAIAFIATQYAGYLLGSAFFFMAIISSLLILLALWRMFGAFRTGAASMSVSGGDNGNGGFLNVDLNFGGEAGNDAEDAEDAERDAEEHEEVADEELDAAEQDASSGSTQQSAQEAEEAAEDIQQAIKKMDIAAKDIEELLQLEHEELQQTLNELSQTFELERKEEGLIQTIKNDLDESGEIIQNQIIPRMQDNQFDIGDAHTVMGGTGTTSPGLNNVLSDISEVSEAVQKFTQQSDEERKEVDEEVKELTTEVKQLLEAHKLLQELKNEDKAGYKLDEELESFAEAISSEFSEQLHEEAEQEEAEEAQIKQQVRQMLEQEEEIKSVLERAVEVLTSIDQLDKEEVDQLKAEDEEVQKLGEGISQIFEIYEQRNIDVKQVGENGEVYEALTSLNSELSNIINSIEKIMAWESDENKEIKSVLSDVKTALDRTDN